MQEIYKEDSTMAYLINDKCTACGNCAPECVFEAISEADGKFVIDADACEDCGACVDACEFGAIEEA